MHVARVFAVKMAADSTEKDKVVRETGRFDAISRFSYLLFILVFVLLIFFLFPFSEIAFLVANFGRIDPKTLYTFVFSVGQKLFFFLITFWILIQLRRLITDFVRQDVISGREFKIGFQRAAEAKANSDFEFANIETLQGHYSSKGEKEFDTINAYLTFRQRMLIEAKRLRSISTRNLMIGIIFSIIALFLLLFLYLQGLA